MIHTKTFFRSACIAALIATSGVGAAPSSIATGRCGHALLFSAQAPPSVAVPTAPSTPAAKAPDAPGKTAGNTDSYTLPYETRLKAIAYSRAGYTLYFVSYFVVIVGLLCLRRFGLVGRLRDFAQRVTEKRWLQGALFLPPLLIAIDLIDLPVSLYWHALSLHYEQSVERWGPWTLDWL